MDSRIVKDMEIVEREACYLIDIIETTLQRIVNYNDLNEQEIKSIKDMAIMMLQEWSQLNRGESKGEHMLENRRQESH